MESLLLSGRRAQTPGSWKELGTFGPAFIERFTKELECLALPGFVSFHPLVEEPLQCNGIGLAAQYVFAPRHLDSELASGGHF